MAHFGPCKAATVEHKYYSFRFTEQMSFSEKKTEMQNVLQFMHARYVKYRNSDSNLARFWNSIIDGNIAM